jgi:mRNA interferase MazF
MARGDVVIVNFPLPAGRSGHEQTGTRPAVVLQSDNSTPNLTTNIIVPLTGSLQARRFPHSIIINPSQQNGLSTQSVMLVFQVRAIDKNRILRTVGSLENGYLDQLENELKNLLGL